MVMDIHININIFMVFTSILTDFAPQNERTSYISHILFPGSKSS